METTRRLWAVLAVLVLSLGLAGCSDGEGLDDEGGIGRNHDVAAGGPGESRFEEEGPRGQEEMQIGGFSVQGPEDEEISIPKAEVNPGDVGGYVDSVRPALDDSVRDLSSLVDTDAGLEGETANLGLSAQSVEDALEANQDAVEELQNVETPDGLGDINDALTDSRERAVTSYDNINQTFVNDASSGQVSDAIEENLPEIEYSDAETRAILQELERAREGLAI